MCKGRMDGCPRRKSSSDMASTAWVCVPTVGRTFQEAQKMKACLMNIEEWKKHKYTLKKSCYHRIKCIVTTFLAAFMWKRHLNNEDLAITTHKKIGEVSDGTGTQVISQTVDKCRLKMIQRKLYNVRNPLWEREEQNAREGTVAI